MSAAEKYELIGRDSFNQPIFTLNNKKQVVKVATGLMEAVSMCWLHGYMWLRGEVPPILAIYGGNEFAEVHI